MKGEFCPIRNIFCQEIDCSECEVFWEKEASYKTERFRLRYGKRRRVKVKNS